MKYFLSCMYFLLFLNIPFLALAQNITINDILGIEGGCPLPLKKDALADMKKVAPEPVYRAEPDSGDVFGSSSTPKKVTEVTNIKEPKKKTRSIEQYKFVLKQHFQKIAYTPKVKYRGKVFFQNKEYKWGLKDSIGQVMILPKFDYIKVDKKWDGFIGIEGFGHKYNFYNLQGEAVFSKEYYSISPQYGYFIVKESDGFGVLDATGQVIIKSIYKNMKLILSNDELFVLAESSEGLLLILRQNKDDIELNIPYGGYDIIDGKYLYISQRIIDLATKTYLFCDSTVKIKRVLYGVPNVFYIEKNKLFYYFRTSGKLALENTSLRKAHFSGGVNQHTSLVIFSLEMDKYDKSIKPMYGILNQNFEWVIPPTYNRAAVLSDDYGLFLLSNSIGKLGVVNALGKEIIPFEYGRVSRFGEMIYAFSNKSRRYAEAVSIFDISGKLINKMELKYWNIKYRWLNETSFFMGKVNRRDKETILFDSHFKELYKGNILNLYGFGSHGILIQSNYSGQSKYKAIDAKGNSYVFKVAGKQTTEVTIIDKVHFTNFIRIAYEGICYLYDTKKEKALPIKCDYRYVQTDRTSHYEYLRTRPSNKSLWKWGLIGIDGVEILPPIFSVISSPHHNTELMTLMLGEEQATISWTGDFIFTQYESASLLVNHLYVVKKDGKKGVVNQRNEIVIPIIYENIKYERTTIFATKEGGEKVFYAIDGNVFINP